MMKVKAEIELYMTRPELGQDKAYPRFCRTRSKKYRDVVALFEQIEVPRLKAPHAGYLKLEEDIVYHCHLPLWKSLDMRAELMPWQEYQVEIIQRIWCTVKEAWCIIHPRQNDAVWV